MEGREQKILTDTKTALHIKEGLRDELLSDMTPMFNRIKLFLKNSEITETQRGKITKAQDMILALEQKIQNII